MLVALVTLVTLQRGLRAWRARALTLVFALACVRVARADDLGETKRRADEALVAGRSAEALEAYKKLYEEKKDPALLYNMGRAHQILGDFPAALENMEQFEREATPELRAKVPGLGGLLDELRKKVAQVAITCDVSGATVKIDNRVVGTTPLGRTRFVNAGAAKLVITKDGYYDYKKDVVLPPGGLANVDVHLSSRATEGVLLVRSPIVGASVSIDGTVSGTVPTEVMLTQGPHRVDLARDGYRPTSSSVVVTAGERREVELGLEKETPVTKKWWFWTGIGIVVATGTFVVIALTTERDPGSGTLTPGQISSGLTF